jgi:hypothetical protein
MNDAATSDANTIATPDAAPARAFRYVFVTAETHDAKFGGADAGLAGADQFCANDALGSPLAGLHWHAWLGTWGADGGSSAVNPRDRIADAGTVPFDYRLPTGEVVFRANYHFLEGNLVPEHNVDRDPNGNLVSAEEVWTGSNSDGKTFPTMAGHCVDWTDVSGTNSGAAGWTTHGDAAPTTAWTNASDGHRVCDADTRHHVYCFEVDE